MPYGVPIPSLTPNGRDAASSPRDLPTVVGVGASAGGLDAFTRLLHGLSPDAGLVYVLVQHLAPDHDSFLPELLGRATKIPVAQAVDGMRVEAAHAYVIPPNVSMTITDGHLRLTARQKSDGRHLPIDTFLRSLADVYGAGAVAVILSGAGSDGARGVEAIKEVGGIVYAQDSDSAAHPNMPEAAVATGCVDFVLPPEEIALQLTQLGKYLKPGAKAPAAGSDGPDAASASASSASDDDAVRAILGLLNRRSGVDFTQYRRGTIQRRVLRRMLVHRHETSSEYLDTLRRNPGELDQLFEELLIGVTSFFRDPEAFEALYTTGLPEIMRARSPDAPIRVWVAGCSGGEETYSHAMLLLEFIESIGANVELQLFGTDLSEAAIARARAGVYPEGIAEDVSPERLRRFFVPEKGGYRIAKAVRDLCVFSRQNIVRDPPFSHLDLISCRNVLIYLEQSAQQRVLQVFHYALEPHGLLLLGSAESPGAASELFEPISKRHRLYRRRPAPTHPLDLDFARSTPAARTIAGQPPRPAEIAAREPSGLGHTLDQFLLSRFASHGVVVNERYEVLYFRGDTSRYLTHAAGAASLELVRLVRPELATPLRVALSRVVASGQPAREAHIALTDESPARHVVIDVLPFEPARDDSRRFVVLFEDESETATVEAPSAKRRGGAGRKVAKATKTTQATKATKATKASREVEQLHDELAATKRHLVEVVEQHAATVEELRAAGEEIQSSNEELQSTNEELETTKEEVQSTNEELTTLNEELRHRNRELGEVASDLANVFASATIPIVLVSRDLRLRRFTPAASRVMKVIPTDAGRPFSDVKLAFSLPNIEQLIAATVETLRISEHVLQDEHGAWWSLTIRPYQTVDRRVDGAVLVFADIDIAKRSEAIATQHSAESRAALAGSEEARDALTRANESLAAGNVNREREAADRNALLRKLESAREDERRRLSRELHDEVGQHLTALGLGLEGLAAAAADPGVGARVDALRRLVATLGEELHAIALRLRPKALDDFGLEAAVSSYAQDWAKQSGIAVDIDARTEATRLPSEVENAVYRIVQEALTNIVRHSRATRASVLIERHDGQLPTLVEDNGTGFDAQRLLDGADSEIGLGLLGIRERVVLLNGTMDVESSERGTTLFVRLPIDGAKN